MYTIWDYQVSCEIFALPYCSKVIYPKSLYISCTVRIFYGTEIEIWAGFGLVDNTERKNEPIMSNF